LCPAPHDVAGPGWNLEGVSTLTNNTPIRALLIDHVPVASVYFDVRATVDVPIRWRALAGRLGDDGAQTEIIEALTQRVVDAVPGPGVLAGRAGRRRPPRHRRFHRPRFLATVDHLLQTAGITTTGDRTELIRPLRTARRRTPFWTPAPR